MQNLILRAIVNQLAKLAPISESLTFNLSGGSSSLLLVDKQTIYATIYLSSAFN